MKKELIFIALVTTILIIVFSFYHKNQISNAEGKVRIGETYIPVLIADTNEERVRGLSGTKSLSDGLGMLFIFEQPAKYGFWMKDMSFDIDIVWIDIESRVIGLEKWVSRDSYPKVFYPPGEVKYVLELSAGFIDKNEIYVGEVVELI